MVPTSEAQGMLTMRKWVVTSILDSEHNYVSMLDVLLQVFVLIIATPCGLIYLLQGDVLIHLTQDGSYPSGTLHCSLECVQISTALYM